MSTYEDYNRASNHYDASRNALGVEIILGHLLKSTVPLTQQHILDAGCGTGNYLDALHPYLGKMTGVDMNPGMLAKTRQKLDAAIGQQRIELHQSSIIDLPFLDNNFDGAVINQVLHHFGDSNANQWETHKMLFCELARVLKRGARLTINLCSRHQLRHGFWYYALIPNALEQMVEKHIPLETLDNLANESGFIPQSKTVPIDALMQGQAYFNGPGVLDSAWRDGDSMWSLVSEDALHEVLNKVNTMQANDELERFVAQHDAQRLNIGQHTFWCARLQ